MSRETTDGLAKWIGLTAGLAAAAALLIAWRVPATTGTLGADVKLVASPPGELTLKPAGAFLQGSRLTAGGAAATGRLELRNITGRALDVRVRLLPALPDLDGTLRVELEDAGDPVAVGRLGALRDWSGRAVRIGPGKSRRLDARVLVTARAANYEGRIVDVTLELRARAVES
jgi:hypothetical protein